jgi:hypothetical protein
MFRIRYVPFCLMLTVAAAPAFATTISSTTYANWISNVSGTPTFEDVETLPLGNYNTSAGVSDGGYIFTGPDGSAWSLGVQTYGNKTGIYGASDGTGGIQVNLPGSGQSAIYFYANTVSSNMLSNGSLTLSLSDGETFNINSGQFGLSISHPITSFELTTTSGQAAFLQWAYFGNSSLPQDGGTGGPDGGDTPTSEAATIALVSGGMLVVFGLKRRMSSMSVQH